LNLLLGAAIGGLSFVTYTILREPDVRSTEDLAKVIDLQKHEVNPTIAWLAPRIGLPRAMRLTWSVIATLVAASDAYLNMNFPYGVPIFALVAGFGHILAAANNKHVAYVVQKMGAEEFEREHDERMRELAKLSLGGKLRLIYRSNPRSILMLILTLPLVAALGYAMVATELFTVVVSHDLLLVIPLNVAFSLIIATLVIEPAFALAPLILSRRYQTLTKDVRDEQAPSADTVNIQVPVPVVLQALEAAKRRGQAVVRIAIPISPSTGEGKWAPNGGD
jgi:hypothetical protein